MIVIGLDIGGSKTHAVRAENGTLVGEAWAGSANIRSVGVEQAARQLDGVLAELGTDDVTAVCAGAAGVDSPGEIARLHGLLAARLPAARIRVVHDTHLILAAAEVEHGIAVIAGTGSVAWGRSADGTEARAGGLGYLLGDEGSGYWTGREAVRHAVGLLDAGAPADALTTALVADCGLAAATDLLDHFYGTPERRYWAARSRLVAELAGDGDPAATAIIDRGAEALAGLAVTVGTRLGRPGPVVLGGGFAVHQPLVQRAVTARLAAAGYPDVRVLRHDPVTGAVRLAADEPSTSTPTPTPASITEEKL